MVLGLEDAAPYWTSGGTILLKFSWCRKVLSSNHVGVSLSKASIGP